METGQQQMEAARRQLREAIRRALRGAIEHAPGNRAAALRRAHDELLQVLSRGTLPDGEHTAEESIVRSMLLTEVEVVTADLLRELAGRKSQG